MSLDKIFAEIEHVNKKIQQTKPVPFQLNATNDEAIDHIMEMYHMMYPMTARAWNATITVTDDRGRFNQ